MMDAGHIPKLVRACPKAFDPHERARRLRTRVPFGDMGIGAMGIGARSCDADVSQFRQSQFIDMRRSAYG